MTGVHHFTYGWLSPALSYVLSLLGCLLGIMLASKARKRFGGARIRLLIYAAFAFGGVGIWQAQVTALLGINVPEAVVRFDPAMLGLGLAVAVVDVGIGLYLVTRGRLVAGTLIPAGLIIGLGAAATSYAVLGSLEATAIVTYDPVRFGATVILCVALAPFALWSVAALRGLQSTVIAAVLLALLVTGIHYGGQYSMVVHFRQSMTALSGLSSATLIAPIMLGGSMVAIMLVYFTVGSSTLRELRAIYGPHENADPIEPWLIEEVTERVASGTGFSPLPVHLDRNVRLDLGRRPPRRRPTPGIRPSWQRMPVPAGIDHFDLARNDADRRHTWPASRTRLVEEAEIVKVEVTVINAFEARMAAGGPLPRRGAADISSTAPTTQTGAAEPGNASSDAATSAQGATSTQVDLVDRPDRADLEESAVVIDPAVAGPAAPLGEPARRWRNRRSA